ncbi:MAG: S1C family serine protease [Planctomycetota bacterium]
MSQAAVVRVFATSQNPNYACPWQREAPSDSTGSGVVIAPNQILTGAHVVANATFIQIQKISDPDKFIARLRGIDHDSDLALLVIDDQQFMGDIEPARLGELPHFQDRVAVIGFPIGGDEISITEGIVSRIEVQRYVHSQRALLAVTVDAAINEGNSGGPVLDTNGHVVGIAFQSMEDAENVGEMVPAPIIERFLAGVEAGRRLPAPGIGVYTHNLENPTLRESLGMSKTESGLLVESVDFGSSAWGTIQPGDALLEIDGRKIANNGTIRYRERYRTGYEAILGERFIGEKLDLAILRDGERSSQTIELKAHCPLIPYHLFDREPQWFIFGGLIFQTLTREYLRAWGEKWRDRAPKELMHLHYSGVRTEQRQEVIVLSHVLADEINVGYGSFADEPIVAINGHQPTNLADLVSRVDSCDGLLDVRTSTQARLVLDAPTARLAGPSILERYGVGTDRAANLNN